MGIRVSVTAMFPNSERRKETPWILSLSKSALLKLLRITAAAPNGYQSLVLQVFS